MLKNRIKKVREFLKIGSQEEFSEKTNFPISRIKDLERGKVKALKPEEAIFLEENFHFSGWWLLTGRGEMLLEDKKNLESFPKPSNNHGYEIDLLNVRAGAGEGIYNYEVEVIDKIVLDKSFFRTNPDIQKIKIIEIDGDSMEPTLYNGDFIVVDESKTNKVDGIYAIQLDGQLLVKRLEFNINNTVTIISDNKKYSNKLYDPKETQIPFHLIGMKTLSIQR